MSTSWAEGRAKLGAVEAARANPKRVPLPDIEGDFAVVMDVTIAEYHADPCPVPALSKSVAHTMVTKSPAHARAEHPRFGGAPGERSDATDEGEIVHRILLGEGPEIVCVDALEFRSNAAKAARDEALAAGKIPLTRPKYSSLMIRVERIQARCDELGFHFNGRSEIPVMWRDNGVICRSLFDHLEPDGRLLEVKKTRSAAALDFERQVYDFGYDIQSAAYTRALARLHPELEGRAQMIILAVEIDPPYEVVPFVMDGAYREVGTMRWERARQCWQECLRDNRWPGYFMGGAPQQLHPPGYILQREIGTASL